MISDALGIFPRLCQQLSDAVFRKTKGNPFFALEFLNSLVARGLLQYSFRERRWIWDYDKIIDENITDNVLHLLSAKMISLSENQQTALKVASCFGMKVEKNIVTQLSAASQYSTFQQELEHAVCEGFMDKNESCYTFIHDKVREAAYSLIGDAERGKNHYSIGMLLYNSSKGQDIGDMLFVIANQINLGQCASIEHHAHRICIAELNCKAASRAMSRSNFNAAHHYSNVAAELLPVKHWENYYELSRHIFLLLGNAAYVCGCMDDATDALNAVLSKGSCLEDKLDAYTVMISLQQARQGPSKAYETCLEVLSQLGEEVPTSLEPERLLTMVSDLQDTLSAITDEQLLEMKETDIKTHYSVMQFYTEICFLSYFVRPKMMHYFASKMVDLTLKYGVCKYSAMCFAQYGMMLGGNLAKDIQSGCRYGKIALSLLKRFDAVDQIPSVYLCNYG